MSKLVLAAAALSASATSYAAPVKNTIVLVHGAFADGSSWDRVTPLLEAKGYNVIAVHESLSSLADDVAATKRAIAQATGKVTLVGHSYGGAVITEAGNDDKVTGLVYIAAFAPDTGESINDLGKGQPAPPWLKKLIVTQGFAALPADAVATDFAQDLGATETQLMATKQGPIALRCFDDKISKAAWHAKPSWYLRSEADHMIDPQAQALMAKRAGAATKSVKASHVPMLSKPQDVAETILAAATGAKS